eukprot:gene731-795_t
MALFFWIDVQFCLLLLCVVITISRSSFLTIPCEVKIQCGSRNWGNELLSILHGLHHAGVYQTALSLSKNCSHKILPAQDFLIGKAPSNCNGSLFIDPWKSTRHTWPTDPQLRDSGLRLSKYLNLTLKPWLTDLLAIPKTLTIYLRAGDIFSAVFHPLYIQAPCLYYEVVIRDHQPDQVVVVTSTVGLGANPCIKELNQLFPSIHFVVILDSVEASFAVLSHSRQLVLSGMSTFGEMAMMTSMIMEKVIAPVFSWKSAYHTPVTDRFNGLEVVRYYLERFPPGGKWTKSVSANLDNQTVEIAKWDPFSTVFDRKLTSYSTLLVVPSTSSSPVSFAVSAIRKYFHILGSMASQRPSIALVLADCTRRISRDALAKALSLSQRMEVAVMLPRDANSFPCGNPRLIPRVTEVEFFNAFNTSHLVVVNNLTALSTFHHFRFVREGITKILRIASFKTTERGVRLVATKLGYSYLDD